MNLSASPADIVREAQDLFAQSRNSEAQQALEIGLGRFPLDVDLHAWLARARWMNGAGERFADPALAALKAQPRHLALRLTIADLMRVAGMRAEAERLLRDGLALQPDDVMAQAWLAILLDELGRLDEALVLHDRVVGAFPGEPVPRLNRAHTLMRFGRRPAKALEDVGLVRDALPHNQLAICYEETALRQAGDARARWLCDYDRHVQVFDLSPPAGYSDITAFNRDLSACLRSLQNLAAHPLEQSLRGGSQTGQNLIQRDEPILRAYFAALDAPIRAYIAAMGDDRAHPLGSRRTGLHALSGCWSVLLRPGGYHVNHTHPEGWISSSYYVALPAGMAGAADQSGWIKFGEPRWPIPGCGIERVVEPREGRLVLFPSYMWHGTVPFRSGERLTAPFDVVPLALGAGR